MALGEITAHLPALRRYARFLCRSNPEADLMVARALEDLASDFDVRNLSREGLFKSLHRHWIAVDAPAREADDRLDGVLAPLAPGERAAFLLCAFERFSRPVAADILGVDRSELDARLDGAHAKTPFGRTLKVLIVEDDVLTAQMLEKVVADLGLEAIGVATSCRQAVAAAASEHPDLIVSDIILGADGSGIEAVREIRESLEVAVVFVTAFPDRLMDRELSDRTYLVRKPLNRMALTGCIREAISHV